MNGWALACLAAIAVALIGMAIAQVVLALGTIRMARQVANTMQEFRRELRPVIVAVQKVADEASKTTAIALVQVERLDLIMESAARRIDDTLATVQEIVGGPVRNGAALIAGLRAAFEVFRGVTNRGGGRSRQDEEDAMFIG